MNITGEEKERKWALWLHTLHWKDVERNLLFLLLQNKALFQSYHIRSHHKRNCKQYLRNSGWFSNVWENYKEERFKTTFRVSRETFTNILGFIRDDLQCEYFCETPISPEERLGICLHRLGRGHYQQTISELTGRGRKKYYSKSIKPYCNQTLENICCFPKNWRRI